LPSREFTRRLLVNLDVRVPIGGFFSLLGLLLTGYGWATLGAPGASPTGLPIDLVWGVALFVFGVAMLGLARRAHKSSKEGLHK
jgi:hypothetical protein